MGYRFPPDVAILIQERMASGGYANEDEVIRDALDALGLFTYSETEADDEYRQTVDAVREGVADMEAGRMRPLREVISEDRRRSS